MNEIVEYAVVLSAVAVQPGLIASSIAVGGVAFIFGVDEYRMYRNPLKL
jgi:hypothetical protein